MEDCVFVHAIEHGFITAVSLGMIRPSHSLFPFVGPEPRFRNLTRWAKSTDLTSIFALLFISHVTHLLIAPLSLQKETALMYPTIFKRHELCISYCDTLKDFYGSGVKVALRL